MSLTRSLIVLSLCAGCVATVQERPPRSTYTLGAPPLPLGEARPAPPAPGMVWAPGYWHWAEVQYVWVPGHWESPPSQLTSAVAPPAAASSKAAP